MTKLEFPYLLNVSKYLLSNDAANFRMINKKCQSTEYAFTNFIPVCFEYTHNKFVLLSRLYSKFDDVFELFPNIQTLYISINVIDEFNFVKIVDDLFKTFKLVYNKKVHIKFNYIYEDDKFKDLDDDIIYYSIDKCLKKYPNIKFNWYCLINEYETEIIRIGDVDVHVNTDTHFDAFNCGDYELYLKLPKITISIDELYKFENNDFSDIHFENADVIINDIDMPKVRFNCNELHLPKSDKCISTI